MTAFSVFQPSDRLLFQLSEFTPNWILLTAAFNIQLRQNVWIQFGEERRERSARKGVKKDRKKESLEGKMFSLMEKCDGGSLSARKSQNMFNLNS